MYIRSTKIESHLDHDGIPHIHHEICVTQNQTTHLIIFHVLWWTDSTMDHLCTLYYQSYTFINMHMPILHSFWLRTMYFPSISSYGLDHELSLFNRSFCCYFQAPSHGWMWCARLISVRQWNMWVPLPSYQMLIRCKLAHVYEMIHVLLVSWNGNLIRKVDTQTQQWKVNLD